MAFERGLVPEDCRSTVNVPLLKGKKKNTYCKTYRDSNLLSMTGKSICRYIRGNQLIITNEVFVD